MAYKFNDSQAEKVKVLVQRAIDAGEKGTAAPKEDSGISLTATGITYEIMVALNLI